MVSRNIPLQQPCNAKRNTRTVSVTDNCSLLKLITLPNIQNKGPVVERWARAQPTRSASVTKRAIATGLHADPPNQAIAEGGKMQDPTRNNCAPPLASKLVNLHANELRGLVHAKPVHARTVPNLHQDRCKHLDSETGHPN